MVSGHSGLARPACGLVAALIAVSSAAGQDGSAKGSPDELLRLSRDEAFRPVDTRQQRPAAQLAQDAEETAAEPTAAEEEQAGFNKAFEIGLGYTLVSDYIFRGINFSEYAGEGREKPNHQLSTSLSVDLEKLGLGPIGSIGFDTWYEWFAAQEKINGEGANIQEIDFVVYWAYDIEPIATDLSIGWTHYSFPNSQVFRTNEWWFSLEHNDAWMWKWLLPDNEDGVLNPTFFFAHDWDLVEGAWMELGISHGFEFEAIPYTTFTPGMKLAVDMGYLGSVTGTDDHDTRLAYVEYSLAIDFDLSGALSLPEELGSITLTPFLNFNDALGGPESHRTIQDEFYGGVSVGWSW